MGETLLKGGLDLVTGGTDNHLMLVDLRPKKLTGKVGEDVLGKAGVAASRNATALAAITCISGPPWLPGKTDALIVFA